MNLLGLDIGGRRIGVAVSRGSNIIATALATIEYDDEADALARLAAIIKAEKIGIVVFGVPVDQTGVQEEKVRAFVAKLKPLCGAEFAAVDESFTTRKASAAMAEMKVKRKKKKRLVDRLAAALILQDYIDSRRNGSTKNIGGQR